MKRLILVYNPRSSRYARVRKEVLAPVRRLKGWMIGRFEVVNTDVDDNARRLAKILKDDDLVVAAGGDAAATIAVNGIMLSGFPEVKLAVLGYGNFNDVAKSFGNLNLKAVLDLAEKDRKKRVWALDLLVDGKHFRYGMSYFTVGMFAESCALFDEPEIREKLCSGKKGVLFSIKELARWWRRERKRRFLPDFEVIWRGGKTRRCTGCTDYVAVNGLRMAQLMKGRHWCLLKDEFQSEVGNLSSFGGLMRIMLPSIVRQIPGEETKDDVLKFDEGGEVMVQAEGEYKRVKVERTIEVKKARRPIWVIGDF